ncbi:MAG: sigma-E factor negative regulatory protein [Burkholderiales bacterium]|nr:sigma-E factor negative regulatory protein [Burkholderiales bacterium]
MSSGFESGTAKGERLSALADGEVDGAAAADACGAWKSDAELRRTWHAWHLIGDVLRSEDLASSAERDQAFLVALRLRMAAEPVVLAPAPLPVPSPASSRRSTGRWLLPSSVAAGFMLVVGTFVVLGPAGTPTSPAPTLARSAPPTSPDGPIRQASIRESAAPEAVALNGRMIRDARLERYLAAHKQFAGTSALGVPSTFLRSATVDAEPR